MKLDTALAVAALLPGSWTAHASINPIHSFLVREDGMSLFAATGINKENTFSIRLNPIRMDDKGLQSDIGMIIPTEKKTPQINLDCKKSPEKIAHDIVTRILNDANAAYEQMLSRLNQTRTRYLEKFEGLQMVADAFGGIIQNENLPIQDKRGHFHGGITTHNGKDFDLKLHNISREQAVKLAEFLKGIL